MTMDYLASSTSHLLQTHNKDKKNVSFSTTNTSNNVNNNSDNSSNNVLYDQNWISPLMDIPRETESSSSSLEEENHLSVWNENIHHHHTTNNKFPNTYLNDTTVVSATFHHDTNNTNSNSISIQREYSNENDKSILIVPFRSKHARVPSLLRFQRKKSTTELITARSSTIPRVASYPPFTGGDRDVGVGVSGNSPISSGKEGHDSNTNTTRVSDGISYDFKMQRRPYRDEPENQFDSLDTNKPTPDRMLSRTKPFKQRRHSSFFKKTPINETLFDILSKSASASPSNANTSPTSADIPPALLEETNIRQRRASKILPLPSSQHSLHDSTSSMSCNLPRRSSISNIFQNITGLGVTPNETHLHDTHNSTNYLSRSSCHHHPSVNRCYNDSHYSRNNNNHNNSTNILEDVFLYFERDLENRVVTNQVYTSGATYDYGTTLEKDAVCSDIIRKGKELVRLIEWNFTVSGISSPFRNIIEVIPKFENLHSMLKKHTENNQNYTQRNYSGTTTTTNDENDDTNTNNENDSDDNDATKYHKEQESPSITTEFSLASNNRNPMVQSSCCTNNNHRENLVIDFNSRTNNHSNSSLSLEDHIHCNLSNTNTNIITTTADENIIAFNDSTNISTKKSNDTQKSKHTYTNSKRVSRREKVVDLDSFSAKALSYSSAEFLDFMFQGGTNGRKGINIAPPTFGKSSSTNISTKYSTRTNMDDDCTCTSSTSHPSKSRRSTFHEYQDNKSSSIHQTIIDNDCELSFVANYMYCVLWKSTNYGVVGPTEFNSLHPTSLALNKLSFIGLSLKDVLTHYETQSILHKTSSINGSAFSFMEEGGEEEDIIFPTGVRRKLLGSIEHYLLAESERHLV